MPRPRIVNDEQRERLAWVARTRRSLPSNKQLAYEMGVSERTIEAIMTQLVRGLLRKPTNSIDLADAKIS